MKTKGSGQNCLQFSRGERKRHGFTEVFEDGEKQSPNAIRKKYQKCLWIKKMWEV